MSEAKMNYPKIIDKWWLMIVYGILLIFLSYYIFSISGKQLSNAGIIGGFISFLTGAVSISGYFFSGSLERSRMELITGIFSCTIGLFFLGTILISQIIVNWLFSLYMIINMLIILDNTSNFKDEINCWWFTVLLSIYTLIICFLIITGLSVFNLPVSLLAGVQIILTGLLMIITAFILRKEVVDYKKTLRQIREE